MNYDELVNAGVQTQPVYEPGKPIEVVARDYGLAPEFICKLASNENPFGPSPKAVAAGVHALKNAHLYPDGGCCELRREIAQKHDITPESILVGNGSNELIELLGRKAPPAKLLPAIYEALIERSVELHLGYSLQVVQELPLWECVDGQVRSTNQVPPR